MTTTYDVDDLVTALARRLVDGLESTQVQRLAQALHLPEPDPEAVFLREGQFWTLRYAGTVTRLRDARGLQHLARLLAQPGTPVHVLALVADAPAPGGAHRGHDVPLHVGGHDGGPALDAQARASYRRRLDELDEELDEARERCDEGRLWRLLAERDALVAELSRAVGLGGRDRRTASPAERARVAVRKAVRASVETIDEHHPALAAHLRTTVRTGTFCCYTAVDRPAWRC